LTIRCLKLHSGRASGIPLGNTAFFVPLTLADVARISEGPQMRREGAGSEVLQRIAGPMIGGLVTAVLLSLLLIPALFLL